LAPVDALLMDLRRRLLGRAVLRSLAIALLAAGAVAGLLVGTDLLVSLPAGSRRVLRWLPALLLALPVAAVARSRARGDADRLALLLDERGGLGNLASTLRAPNARGPVAELFRARALGALRSIDPGAVVPLDAGRLWGACLVAGLVVVAGVALLPNLDDTLAARWVRAEAGPVVTRAAAGAVPTTPGAPPSLGSIAFTVRAPAYAGLPDVSGAEGDPLSALPGSIVEIRGTGTARPPVLRASIIGGGELTPRTDDDGWSVAWTVGPEDRGVVLSVLAGGSDGLTAGASAPTRGPEALAADPDTLATDTPTADTLGSGSLLDRRVLALRPLRDRAPTVSLDSPEEDIVLAAPTGRIPIEARARDDYGVADLVLHWVRSRGSGESFDFDEGTWAWDRSEATGDGRVGELSLALDELGLEPGDVLHVRATASDANDMTGPGRGVSATRQIRISAEDDLSDVTTIIGFPIEREREPLLSQRMIILLTEELIDSAATLTPDEVVERSRDIAEEQARLRGRVGEQIFSRATGAMQDPEAHLDFEEGEPAVFLDELEAQVERGPVIDPVTGIATIANVEIPAHDHDSDPIVAINRSLLTIYNHMWDAERALSIAQLEPSLVPQNLALDALQAMREGERVFVRGRVTVAPIDIPAARGTGEVDEADPVSRSPVPPVPGVARTVATEIETLLAASTPLTGRAASVAISGLALDLLEGTDRPEVGELLARASTRAADDDAPGAVAALERALRLLRSSEARAVDTKHQDGPASLGAAHYLRATSESADTVSTIRTGASTPSEPVPFVFATVRYESGDWDSAPLVPANLIHSMAQYTALPVAPEGVTVDLSSPEIFHHPFLYLTGHLPVFFDDAESRNLVDFVERGGLIFIDDHNHDIDGAFHRSVTSEIARLFGADALQAIPNEHELYSSFFEFEDGPPITGHELSGWGDGLIHRNLFQVEVDGRIGVLYSNKDYSSEWSYHAVNKRFLAVDNTRFGVNILLYALTR
jgi:hypothetical protein